MLWPCHFCGTVLGDAQTAACSPDTRPVCTGCKSSGLKAVPKAKKELPKFLENMDALSETEAADHGQEVSEPVGPTTGYRIFLAERAASEPEWFKRVRAWKALSNEERGKYNKRGTDARKRLKEVEIAQVPAQLSEAMQLAKKSKTTKCGTPETALKTVSGGDLQDLTTASSIARTLGRSLGRPLTRSRLDRALARSTASSID